MTEQNQAAETPLPQSLDNRLRAMELVLPRPSIAGTTIQRVLHPEAGLNWSLALGPMSMPKSFFTGSTLEDVVSQGEAAVVEFLGHAIPPVRETEVSKATYPASPQAIEQRLCAMEAVLPRKIIAGTKLTRVMREKSGIEWCLALGPMDLPKTFFKGASIDYCVTRAETVLAANGTLETEADNLSKLLSAPVTHLVSTNAF